MQNVKHYLPLLSLSAMVLVPVAVASPEAAAEQLRAALTRELELLESVQDAASAATACPPLEMVLEELASMERSHEAEKTLWIHIDNTPGIKQPLIELIQRLCVEFARLENASFYGHAALGEVLAPQLAAPVMAAE